jgi:hypothetical protein
VLMLFDCIDNSVVYDLIEYLRVGANNLKLELINIP